MRSTAILEVQKLVVDYRQRVGWRFWKSRSIRAVNDVSLTLKRGEVLGIVGESGSGKSTLIKAIGHFVPATSGKIISDGKEVQALNDRQFFPYRRRLQIIPQNFSDALDPTMSVEAILREPLKIHFRLTAKETALRIGALLESVELDSSLLHRYPVQLSGGQRQRISIARGLAVSPEVLICDEMTSACDVLVQKRILSLLDNLRHKHNMAILWIAHNIAVVAHFCDTMIVMRHGRFLELGEPQAICQNPVHPYTRLLVDAVPHI
ncbi:MAG: ATP-binding cassette domain-containing protein [Opitutales bacterium]|nr:ATP-binding cassette domain-containing protein [Opitutales bacterium]